MRQGGQPEHQGHGAVGSCPTIWDYIAVICGSLVTGLALGIALASLWLGP